MLKLLLVGDKPSSKNKDPEIAFVGTASHKRIQEWLKVLAPNGADAILVNRVDPGLPEHLVYASLKQYKIIALGEEAAIELNAYGITNFFKLPHPSGRNRKLNNKAYVEEVLQKCKEWLEANG